MDHAAGGLPVVGQRDVELASGVAAGAADVARARVPAVIRWSAMEPMPGFEPGTCRLRISGTWLDGIGSTWTKYEDHEDYAYRVRAMLDGAGHGLAFCSYADLTRRPICSRTDQQVTSC